MGTIIWPQCASDETLTRSWSAKNIRALLKGRRSKEEILYAIKSTASHAVLWVVKHIFVAFRRHRYTSRMNFFLLLVAILGLRYSAYAAMLTLDYTTFPESCNNDCYGIFSARQPSSLTWDMPSASLVSKRRRGSGCTYSKTGSSVCSSSNGVAPWNKYGASCDEYP